VADTRRTDEDLAQDILKRLDQLKLIRQPFESAIDECIEFTAPDLQKINEETNKGQKTGTTVYDGTAISALNLLADGLHGYLVSPGIRWFSLTLPVKMSQNRASQNMRQWGDKSIDEIPEVKRWLESVEETMYADFRASNFYEATPMIFRQGGAIGTVSCFCESDPKTGKIIFFVPHFRECYIAQDRFGKVDTCYRKKPLTRRELFQKFGLDKMTELDPTFKDKLERAPYEETNVIHAIYPREDFDFERVDNKNMPWASVWLLESGQKKLIDESGFPQNPQTTWRWTSNSNEWYGRAPAWFAMVDILKAQQMALTNLKAGHRAADPPYAMMESLRGRANLNAAGRTYLRQNEEAPEALDTGLRALPIAEQFLARTDQAIREHFHVDFFLMLSQAAFNKTQMTATQVIEMQGEKAAILGTRIGRLQSEFLNPVIDQVFTIDGDSGRLPPPPDILYEYAGAQLEVDYLGPLAQAQKRLFKTQTIQAALQSAAPLAELMPDALDIIDGDATMREILETNGLPAKCIRDSNVVDAIRKTRQQAIQAQQIDQGLLTMSKALPGMSKAPEEGSPMDALGKALAGGRG